ncbi:MAG: hypothetical protein HQL25_06905 [Candidatus Omnitrophica bacterium]|nr:hypothetical protein [Candidatus Omnitrophota bacterium]
MVRAQRQSIIHINKYQRKILFISIFPSLILIAVLSLLFSGAIKHILQAAYLNKPEVVIEIVQKTSFFFFVSLWVFLALITILALNFSSNLCGGFDRIIREMDDVIKYSKKRPISVRKNDKLFVELLDRINKLIDKMKDPGSII